MTQTATSGAFVHDDAVAPQGALFLGSLRLSETHPAFAAAVTPDATVATIWEPGAATNNVTYNAPTNAALGQILIIVTTQDGTGGRTITYNAVFKTGGAAAVTTTLSTKNIDVFFFDGTNWRIIARITGQAI